MVYTSEVAGSKDDCLHQPAEFHKVRDLMVVLYSLTNFSRLCKDPDPPRRSVSSRNHRTNSSCSAPTSPCACPYIDSVFCPSPPALLNASPPFRSVLQGFSLGRGMSSRSGTFEVEGWFGESLNPRKGTEVVSFVDHQLWLNVNWMLSILAVPACRLPASWGNSTPDLLESTTWCSNLDSLGIASHNPKGGMTAKR